MLKIGFADYYLDNWHANNYPQFLRETIEKYGIEAKITHAYALHDKEGGLTTAKWCCERDIIAADSMRELVDSVDAIMVIAADDASWHEEVADLALRSGKAVFVDKTFAPDLATAKRMFALANTHSTAVFSSSAQRYCQSVLDYIAVHGKNASFVSTVGPHSLDSYAVHQLELISALMGTGVKRLKAFAVGKAVTQLILDFGEGRMASFMQTPQPYAEFNFMVSDGSEGERLVSDDGNFYHNLCKEILDFFVSRAAPVSQRETLEIIAIIETAREARKNPDEWFTLAVGESI